MGGMDNKTSKELTRAKQRSRRYHAKKNEVLYKEYLSSGGQYLQNFADWKRTRKNVSL